MCRLVVALLVQLGLVGGVVGCSYPPLPDAEIPSCVPARMITDIEEASAGFGSTCPRGQWYLEALNGTTMPVAPGQPDNVTPVMPTRIDLGSNPLDSMSTYAVHVTGSGQENVGDTFAFAQLTVSLNAPSETQIGSVDASAYTGIEFSAIVNTGSTGARLTVANLYTDPIGGKCTTSCFDHPGAPLPITTTWTKYQIPFASLVPNGVGNQNPMGAMFPKNAITLLKWDIGIPRTGATEPWELWVDDLSFY